MDALRKLAADLVALLLVLAVGLVPITAIVALVRLLQWLVTGSW